MAVEQFYTPKTLCPFCTMEYEQYGLHIFEKHPISCEEVSISLGAYCDGALNEETDERVICHLSKCSSCYDELTLHIGTRIKERKKEQK